MTFYTGEHKHGTPLIMDFDMAPLFYTTHKVGGLADADELEYLSLSSKSNKTKKAEMLEEDSMTFDVDGLFRLRIVDTRE